MSATIVLLCEDRQIATFIRRFLMKRGGWTRYDFRALVAPSGQGSGEQWVRENFPNELKSLRSRRTVLVVGTDADKMSVSERIGTLEQECEKQEIPFRTPQEAVVMVVPKRNIETWFAYLQGKTTDPQGETTDAKEETVYQRYQNESDCRGDVSVLYEMCRTQKLSEPVPPSLRAACGEYQRMPAKNAYP